MLGNELQINGDLFANVSVSQHPLSAPPPNMTSFPALFHLISKFPFPQV